MLENIGSDYIKLCHLIWFCRVSALTALISRPTFFKQYLASKYHKRSLDMVFKKTGGQLYSPSTETLYTGTNITRLPSGSSNERRPFGWMQHSIHYPVRKWDVREYFSYYLHCTVDVRIDQQTLVGSKHAAVNAPIGWAQPLLFSALIAIVPAWLFAVKSTSVASCRYFGSGVQLWYNLCSISIN